MASTPDLCEDILYLFPIQIQNKFIIRYKSLKLFHNYYLFNSVILLITFHLLFIYILLSLLQDILRVVATEDLQIKLVNIFLQNNLMLALKTYFLSAYI